MLLHERSEKGIRLEVYGTQHEGSADYNVQVFINGNPTEMKPWAVHHSDLDDAIQRIEKAFLTGLNL